MSKKNLVSAAGSAFLLCVGVYGGALDSALAQSDPAKPTSDGPAATSQTTATILPPNALQWGGDLRYRHEWLGQEAASLTSMHQHRLRARLGAKAALAANTQVEVRLATGPGRTSTNQTLGTGASAFANYEFRLDRAYFKWTPSPLLALSGGRGGNPFFLPGESDLVWDADLNFDGLALNGSTQLGAFTLFWNGGHFWIDKSSTAGRKDTMLDSLQAGARHSVTERFHWALAGAFHQYNGVLNHSGFVTTSDTSGNTSVASGTTALYATDFNLVNVGLELGSRIRSLPIFLIGDFVHNLANTPEKTGWLAGLRIGKPKEAGDWAFGYDYRRLEKDAAVGAFTDGESFGGGTDGRGHRVGALYQVAKHWTIAATYFNGETRISTTPLDRDRFVGDLLFKF